MARMWPCIEPKHFTLTSWVCCDIPLQPDHHLFKPCMLACYQIFWWGPFADWKRLFFLSSHGKCHKGIGKLSQMQDNAGSVFYLKFFLGAPVFRTSGSWNSHIQIEGLLIRNFNNYHVLLMHVSDGCSNRFDQCDHFQFRVLRPYSCFNIW